MPEARALERLGALGFSEPRAALREIRALSGSPFGPALERIVTEAALSPSPLEALKAIEALSRTAPTDVIKELAGKEKGLVRLVKVTSSSPFLTRIITARPDFLRTFFIEDGLKEKGFYNAFLDELERMRGSSSDFDSFSRALRLLRQREFLRLGARDLLGLSTLEEITGELSDLADAFLEAAMRFSFAELGSRYGRPRAGLSIIGLGKLGGRELNYSSDIDIIFISSSERGRTGGITFHEFFTKAARMTTKLISAVTAEGIVFRVDLDLRPEGRAGDIVHSLRSAEIYYESWGAPWERAALIKARAGAGDRTTGERFVEMTRPFVYRRHLDFTAIEEIKAMKERIDLSLVSRKGYAVDVKLGRGGIREIEFFCQTLQLVHGGRVPEIRVRSTLGALEALQRNGLVRERDAELLKEAYIFLRRLEHRLQIIEGRQTQAVPSGSRELERVARMMGFGDRTSFEAAYRKVTEGVHGVYRSLFYKSEKIPVRKEIALLFSTESGPEDVAAALEVLGLRDVKAAAERIMRLREGAVVARLTPGVRLLLEKLAPVFVEKALSSPDPDMALSHLELFLSRAGARMTLYSLLMENPAVTEELLKLFGTSVFLSRGIIEHPENLDLLLAEDITIAYRTGDSLMEEFISAVMEPARDYEERLDELRRLRNREILRIGINDAGGRLTLFQVSRQITYVAEAALEAAYRTAFEEVARRYPAPEGARFAILGLGRLGGRELIYGSDLDIVFVYEGGEDAHLFFVKLCQRIISVLTLKTREGSVFSVDTRLRPSGSAGPLVVSFRSMLDYHRKATAVWERQAFVRARSVAGDIRFGEGVLERLHQIIYGRGLAAGDIGEMLRIRRRMEEELAGENEKRYNIKTGPGGLVDIEFLVQTLQLEYGGRIEALRTPATMKALTRLGKLGLISGPECRTLREAFIFYRLLETRLRVVHDRPEGFLMREPEKLTSLARALGLTDGGALLKRYEGFRGPVREIYRKTLEGLLRNKDG